MQPIRSTTPSLVLGFALLCTAAAEARQSQVEPPRSLAFEEANALAVVPRWLSLRHGGFDTRLDGPAIPSELRAERAEARYFVVQLDAEIDEGNKLALRELGLELMDYIPNRAWIVRGTAAMVDAATAAGLVAWSSPLHPAWRIEPELLAGASPARLAVLGFAGVSGEALRAQVASLGVEVAEQHEQVGRWLLLVPARPGLAQALARLPDAQWVEPESIVSTRNTTMTWSVQTATTNSRRLWDAGLRGEGQIIGHMDGAIATGSCYFSDPANPIGPSHRKLVYTSGTGAADLHGTHTAGTVAGDAQPVNGSTANRGLAYLAKLAHSNNYSAASWSSLATTHRTNGARLHTNSWGNDSTTAYNSHCNAIDAFMWTNEDNLVLFAETNLSTLKNPENAKNLLAVGNALNGASYMSKGGGGVGPTSDGRRKPDLFAPGTNIVSSSTASCGTSSLTGTSMACPAATAAAALVRQYYLGGYYPSGSPNAADALTPTAALVKATLLNTCQDMTGVSATVPNNTEGWGRIVLDETLRLPGDPGRMWLVDVRRASGVTTGATRTYTIDVASSSLPLEITMAFTDYAGAVNATNAAVNNLNLEVVAPNGNLYRGNVYASGSSTTGGTADAINNVERANFNAPQAGTWTVRVLGASVPQGPCGYAVVATGDLAFSAGTPFCFGDGSGVACPCGNSSPAGSNAGCLNSLGTAGTLRGAGTASLVNDGFQLRGTAMANSTALYFQGTTQQNGGLGSAFGDGLRCAAGTVVRLGAKINAAGASIYPDAVDLPISFYVTAPGTRTYQAWYRNAAAYCAAETFNLTNGLSVVWAP
jgi:hypothetical protein